jgi:hypothetical protein
MSAAHPEVVAEPFLAACICPRFAAWLERFPAAAYELAKIVPAEATAVTLRRADLAGVINAPMARQATDSRSSAAEDRRHV